MIHPEMSNNFIDKTYQPVYILTNELDGISIVIA